MSDTPISRYPVPEHSELPEDIRERILTVQEKAGFVPNVFLALAHRPDEFRARNTLGTKPAFSCTARIRSRMSSGSSVCAGTG